VIILSTATCAAMYEAPRRCFFELSAVNMIHFDGAHACKVATEQASETRASWGRGCENRIRQTVFIGSMSSEKLAVPKQTALPANLPPRLIGREAAAAFLNCSPSFFDELLAQGLVPPPRRLGEKKKAWDIQDLNRAADALPPFVKPQMQKTA
jgi:predicted DNA-binding transcriptional regulator AlpA